MDDILIRKMRSDDIAHAAALELRNFSEPWSERGFLDALLQERNLFLAAQSTDGRIVGYCGLYAAADEGEITNVAVDEPFRRRGIADSLLRMMKDQARAAGIRMIFLEVRCSNDAAVRLYEKAGFVTCGIRRGFYRKPAEDALSMCCYI